MASNPPSSPSSSPRLPSPPPMAEDQSGSQSPSITSSELNLRPLVAPAAEQAAASRRIRPGTKAVDMAEGPPLVDLTEIESVFPLTEHLKALHFSHTHPTHLPAVTLAVSAPVALLLATPPPSTDRAIWLYELCRFLVQKVNIVVTSLFADQPPCSAATCPEMRASEWQYLCAVHDPPKACCAIDYCCHTLDWAANVLTNPKHFPSRLALGTENTAPQHQVRQLTNIFRRVYRIFAHAWFSHRDMFWRVEGKTGLYVFFKTVCDMYSLLPEDGYTIPAEAEKSDEETRSRETTSHAANDVQDPSQTIHPHSAPPTPSILKRPPPPSIPETAATNPQHPTSAPPNPPVSTGTSARRHRQTPSTGGGSPVETVMEENEDDEATTTTTTTTSPPDPKDPQVPDAEAQAQANAQQHATQEAQQPTGAQQPPRSFSPFSLTAPTQQTHTHAPPPPPPPPPPPTPLASISTTSSDTSSAPQTPITAAATTTPTSDASSPDAGTTAPGSDLSRTDKDSPTRASSWYEITTSPLQMDAAGEPGAGTGAYTQELEVQTTEAAKDGLKPVAATEKDGTGAGPETGVGRRDV